MTMSGSFCQEELDTEEFYECERNVDESRQVFQQLNRIFARASASEEILQTLLSVDIQKHIWHLP